MIRFHSNIALAAQGYSIRFHSLTVILVFYDRLLHSLG